jgi:hypothetical protein
VGAPMRHFDVPELGRAIAMPPTLVVHDRGDRFTPSTDGAAIAAAWPSARLRLTDGLGHRRLLSDPAVVADVVDFAGAGASAARGVAVGRPGQPGAQVVEEVAAGRPGQPGAQVAEEVAAGRPGQAGAQVAEEVAAGRPG